MPIHPWVYNTAAGAVACLSAAVAVRATPDVVSVATGIAVFVVVNLALIAAAICAARQTSSLRMLRNPRVHIVVVVTQLLGALVGELMNWHQSAGLLVLPALYAFHLWAARGTVEDTKAFDTSTGLWTEEAWTVQAVDLVRAGPYALVIVVDGSPSSDPRMVADVIRSCIRERDLIGTYGGADDKVVIAATFGAAATGRLIAQRVRKSLHQSFSTFYMGYCSTGGEDLQSMLMVALTDLMFERDRSRSENPR